MQLFGFANFLCKIFKKIKFNNSFEEVVKIDDINF